MSEIIKAEVKKAQDEVKKLLGKNISEDRAFSYIALGYVFGVEFVDQDDLVTDGSNDGGIDFVYYDEEEAKVVLCQSKYTESLSFNEVIAEFDKMYSTLQNFRISNTGSYNDKLKRVMQNALDRLPDENTDNIEYNLFTTAPIDVDGAVRKIDNTQHLFSTDAVKIFTGEDLEKEIKNALEALDMVSYEKIKIDRPKNYLEYESSKNRGIMCNVLSTSIIQLYNKYAGQGLFDMNIRKYIRNNLVDSGIKNTLDKDRENFWFLNNGIIIACQDFDIDGDTIKLRDFSIVNGGQTTTLISTYKGTNTREFYIPCKIVCTDADNSVSSFFTKIAEATNSQKPIYARDLKSNAPEMVTLKRLLEREGVFLEIKRGVKSTKSYKYTIKNDELAQLILSFTYQRPGTSRSGKQRIFDNDLYPKLFKVNYFDDPAKKGFLLDIIDLFERFKIIEKKYKQGHQLTEIQLEILKNGRQVIFAIMGVIYRLVNNDIDEIDIQSKPGELKVIPFNYGSFLSNYLGNDLDAKLEAIIVDIVKIVADSYQMAYKNKLTTSVSNYLKTDSKYYDEVIPKFVDALSMLIGQDLKCRMDIFKRSII
jgi:hypothetical protein